ncbi:tRNA (5-methylaminomethyl-2-thiouridine)(34)-methyltransferase MnmD [Siphonobacter curvatus]|uniref:MnmC-like methyltransferase domain-containing protein n=1 Tax=Siphonobacter curvatus TaxID=2094562 RepID=A0A2S7IKX2_9BACT|nr:tRNA (5-methylaminomethyl-2-thiouridine)(34)-methyltransferase MnmD [Siphonobacter curvatus]PQA58325.1 hypothetical protein C5O19_01215 [Siphonobacter curvatus]
MEAGSSNPTHSDPTHASNELVLTKDGSHTLYSARFNQWYHSLHGAFDESKRIFLELGLDYLLESGKREIRILEMGFGTGFNALLTLLKAGQSPVVVDYTSLEAYPIPPEAYRQLNYDEFMHATVLQSLHEAAWDTEVRLSPTFTLRKVHATLQDFLANETFGEPYDLVYYDAFAPSSQPELWTTEIFSGIGRHLQVGSLLTTYCSKSDVRRALKAAGFRVEKHPGPQGKREVVRAVWEPERSNES